MKRYIFTTLLFVVVCSFCFAACETSNTSNQCQHAFVEGVCSTCGETDPNYRVSDMSSTESDVTTEQIETDGQETEPDAADDGADDTSEDLTPPTEPTTPTEPESTEGDNIAPCPHNYIEGVCAICGEQDENYFALKTAQQEAVSELKAYVNEYIETLTVAAQTTALDFLTEKIDLINSLTTEQEIETELQIAGYEFNVIVLQNYKEVELAEYTTQCDTQIAYYTALMESLYDDMYLYSETQYNSDIAYWDKIAADANTAYAKAIQENNEKVASMGLTGSGYHQLLNQQAAKQRDSKLATVTKQKKELARLWENRLQYEEYATECSNWENYKTYALSSVTTRYDELINNNKQAILDLKQ